MEEQITYNMYVSELEMGVGARAKLRKDAEELYESLSVNLFGLPITERHVRVCTEKKKEKKHKRTSASIRLPAPLMSTEQECCGYVSSGNRGLLGPFVWLCV